MDKTRIIHGNALDLPLEDSSVDLVVTSPPYFALRSYRDGDEHYDGQVGSEATPQEFLEALWAATREMVRVLKPSGSIWVNLGDKYAGSGGHNNAGISNASTLQGNGHVGGGPKSKATLRSAPDRYNQNSGGVPTKSLMGLPWRYAIGCVDQLCLILRAEVVWSKPNGLPESVTDRVRRSHEQWFHFTKSPRYFAAVDEIREAQGRPANGLSDRLGGVDWNDSEATSSLGGERFASKQYQPNPLGKLPGSVWTIPSEPLIVPEHLGLPDHFAAFPQEWPRRIILGWSPSGICTACGEGRRPVVEREEHDIDQDLRHLEWERAKRRHTGVAEPTRTSTLKQTERIERTITGYACACDEPTAPTLPAVVLDPFTGTGTVPMVARALGRTGIGVDLSKDYVRLANWRVFQSGHADKAERRTWAERQLGLL